MSIKCNGIIMNIISIPKGSVIMVTQGELTNAQVYSFFVLAFLSFVLHSVSEWGKAFPFLVKQWLQIC